VILFDVNIFVYAHRDDAADHRRFRQWIEEQVRAPEPFGVAELVLSSFVRVVTHPRIFQPPTPLQTALANCRSILQRPNAVLVRPGERHWEIFDDLCTRANARGDLITDAYFAALAIEHGCEWITTDRDFARFPGLRWRQPF
jgi:toxin-antitoxin system PIN domain toxin